MSRRVVRAAMTQTVNRWGPMPQSVDDLAGLADHLEDIRRVNVEHHLTLAERAARAGAQVICFGELFTGPYFAFTSEPTWRGLAEPLDGPTIKEVAAAARELELVIVAPIYEHDPELDKRFNTAVVIDADGSVLGHYSKVHIPHGQNEEAPFLERSFYEGSVGRPNAHASNVSPHRFFPVFATRAGRIGCAICYDRHFEGVMASLAAGGAELVFSPSATFGKKSQRLWFQEFAVDAARHHIFIGGSNRFGSEAPWNHPFYGGTHFIGPNGRIANESEYSELIIADLDLQVLEEPDPAGWKLHGHRRPSTYASIDEPSGS
jgi:N-carbamoylputrescine amidase